MGQPRRTLLVCADLLRLSFSVALDRQVLSPLATMVPPVDAGRAVLFESEADFEFRFVACDRLSVLRKPSVSSKPHSSLLEARTDATMKVQKTKIKPSSLVGIDSQSVVSRIAYSPQ
jgi:hypothetical protein